MAVGCPAAAGLVWRTQRLSGRVAHVTFRCFENIDRIAQMQRRRSRTLNSSLVAVRAGDTLIDDVLAMRAGSGPPVMAHGAICRRIGGTPCRRGLGHASSIIVADCRGTGRGCAANCLGCGIPQRPRGVANIYHAIAVAGGSGRSIDGTNMAFGAV